MALVLADRVRDTTATTGTGTITLSGTAPTGYQTFDAGVGNTNTTYYTINAGDQWEVGIGTYSSIGPTLARNVVLSSSNGGSLVDFLVGTKDVFVTYPSDEAVYQDGAVIAAGTAILGVANGGTGVTTSTGTGSVVLNTSPTLVTPILGAASATSIANGLGAVGTPSYTFTGDLNTGMFSPAADTVAVSTAGAERVRIDSSGNVGIGVSAVAGFGANITTLDINGSSGSGIKLGAGTPSFGIYYAGGNAFLQTFDASPILFATNNAERMRIDSSGNVLVATTSSSSSNTGDGAVFNGANSSLVSRRTTGASRTHLGFVNGGTLVGSITTSTTATLYNVTSDRRLKHDIVNAPDAADLIDAIKVRSFKWNADNSEQRYGFVAQELLEVAPEAVSAPENPDEMMSVDYSKLVPMLIKEVQQLRARVAQLEGN